MKKLVEKFTPIILATLVIIGGVSALPMKKAAAYSGVKTVETSSNFTYQIGYHEIATSEDSSNVYGSVKMAPNTAAYIRMTLQKYEGGAWKQISAHNAGYAYSEYGDIKQAHTTFTNVINNAGRTIRIQVDFFNNSNYTDNLQTAYSYSWTR
ncbi:hypothetical protein CEF21_09965 [Bacillus sp. FJAT-42376]|uniref:hypothetical protein n=1 Tax=Bacillus sp. FJAT-42376 TaxID=2014076 RepID=UPI000F5171DC|nr:hypothetical protein [Bacillus sp. FJAT-42376]AZB42586.1 hypothetical protein CEF21_09965 [Bacillus sp. FJAT-42376]